LRLWGDKRYSVHEELHAVKGRPLLGVPHALVAHDGAYELNMVGWLDATAEQKLCGALAESGIVVELRDDDTSAVAKLIPVL